jgi:hypothetical protein
VSRAVVSPVLRCGGHRPGVYPAVVPERTDGLTRLQPRRGQDWHLSGTAQCEGRALPGRGARPPHRGEGDGLRGRRQDGAPPDRSTRLYRSGPPSQSDCPAARLSSLADQARLLRRVLDTFRQEEDNAADRAVGRRVEDAILATRSRFLSSQSQSCQIRATTRRQHAASNGTSVPKRPGQRRCTPLTRVAEQRSGR